MSAYDYEDFEWLKQLAIEHCKSSRTRSSMIGMELHYEGYKEPGYPHDTFVATGDWNVERKYIDGEKRFEMVCDVPARIGKILEALDVSIEWGDEWTACHQCFGLVRTSADSYSWKRSYFVDIENCGDLLCSTCVKEDPEEYLEYLEGSSNRANTFDLDLSEHGYICLMDRFQNGWYGGQAARPDLIGKLLEDAGFERFIFQIDYVRQFDLDFSVWLHQDEDFERAKKVLETGKTDGEDPAKVLRRGLEEAARQRRELGGARGIVHQKIKGSGVTTTIISPEDFVKGEMP